MTTTAPEPDEAARADSVPVVADEHVVLEKFDAASEKLVERMTVHNGELVKHEFFDEHGMLKEVHEVGGSDGSDDSVS